MRPEFLQLFQQNNYCIEYRNTCKYPDVFMKADNKYICKKSETANLFIIFMS